MSIPNNCSATSKYTGPDSSLAEWAESLADRIQAGEQVDLGELAREFPDRAAELRRLLPAIELMAEFGRSAVASATAGAGSSAGPGLTLTHELEVLGDFRIVREVGRGGMGVVYEAEQVSLRRRVALKILPFAATMDPRHLQRFQLEAQAAACLHHTNIVPVHAVGSERGVAYYAMQFIEGRSLAQVITELRHLDGLDQAELPAPRPAAGSGVHPGDSATSAAVASLLSGRRATSGAALGPNVSTVEHRPDDSEPEAPSPPRSLKSTTPPSKAAGPPSSASSTRGRAYIRNVADLGLQAAEALDHAHDRGILHRDIKPANLMLDAAGHLWVTDFGLAQIQGDSRLTPTGDILGTLRYMSPEQAMARRVVIDGRTDIYSLGVTLYELLTLRPAIDGKDRAEILRRVAYEDPAPLRKLNPAMPRDLETIVQKAMAKELETRYATARELAHDLRHFLEDLPITARRPSLPERAVRWLRRHPTVAAATAIVLVLAVLGSTIGTVLIARQQKETVAALHEAGLRLKETKFWNDLVYGQTSPFSEKGGTLDSDQILNLAEQRVERQFPDDPVVEARIRFRLGALFRQRGEFDNLIMPGQPQLEAIRTIVRQRGANDRAGPHLIRARDLFRRYLGEDDPETLLTRLEYAWILQAMNRALAIGEIRDVLAIQRRTLPPDDPQVLATNLRLAEALVASDRKEAVRLLEQTYEKSRIVRGPNDEVTLFSLHYLAYFSAYMDGHFDRAIEMFNQVNLAQRNSLGRLNAITLITRSKLGDVLWARGDLPRALEVYQQVRDEYRQVDKDGHRAQTFACEVSPWLLLRYLGEDRFAAIELEELLEKWTRFKGEGNDYVEYIRGMQALDRGNDLRTARRCLGDLWRRRAGLWPPICPLDTGKAYAESLAWSGECDQAIHVARGVLAYTEGPPNPDGYTEQHYFVAVSRDLMAAMLAMAHEIGPAMRDVSRPVALATRNVAYFPRDGQFRTTLGIAQYRAGEWDKAIAALKEADRLDEGRRIAPRGFFLAMAYWQKGEKQEAIRWFHKSAAWMDEHRPGHPESARPRNEAARLLGLRVPNSDLNFPADPLAH